MLGPLDAHHLSEVVLTMVIHTRETPSENSRLHVRAGGAAGSPKGKHILPECSRRPGSVLLFEWP